MYCPTCGRFFPGQGSQCELCGAAIPEDPASPASPGVSTSILSLGAQRECRQCHAPLAEGAERCAVCGEAQPRAALQFAGFWLRSAAQLVDLAVVAGIIFGMFLTLALIVISIESVNPQNAFARGVDKIFNSEEPLVGLGIIAIMVVVQWIYFAAMESSSSQATVGKKMLGLRVTDGDGRRIGFARATGRFLGKFISLMLAGGGFVMAAFSDKKQALHDVMVDCLVVRGR